MSKTVVGLFSTTSKAEEVRSQLVADGYESKDINVVANDGTKPGGEGLGEKISSFFHNLTGGDNDVHDHYATGINTGGALLAVTCEDGETEEVAMFLKSQGARDIDSAYEGVATAGVPVDGGASSAEGSTAIPIVEEELVVGKREVDRGGVRVYSHVVETPVSANVSLRNEQINVTRRPVDRVATAADFAAGSGSVLEMNATGEEAIVGKTARVVEEVLVGKQSSQHTEAIHDSVRKTEVEVEQLAGSDTVTKDRF